MTKAEKMRQRAAKLSAPRPVELPSGRWRCQVSVHGQRLSVVEDDPDAAHAKALALKAGLLQASKPVTALTVGEAMDRYITSKDAVLSPATIRGYKRIRRQDLQELMDIQLGALTQEQVQRAVNRMSRDGKSPKTIRNAHGLLSAVLAAYRPEMVLRTTLPQKQPYEAKIPELDEVRQILEAAAGTPMEVPLLLAVWMGLRESEIRGLTWDCIQGGVLHVRQAIVDGENGPAQKGTKTYSGDRYIPIPAHIQAVLDAAPRSGDHVTRLSGQAMYKRFSRLCERLGLPHYRFHDLRHAAASIAMAEGVPNTYLIRRMGHRTDHMLKTVYLHTLRSKESEFAEKIDAAYDALLHTDLHTEGEPA